jgi:hypothetical protein
MKAINRFQRVLLKAVSPILTRVAEGNRSLQDAMQNHIFDLPGPRYANFIQTAEETYVVSIFRGFGEVTRSLEVLEDIHFFVTHFPYRNTRIPAERYLQFHVEAYFGEVYLLKERLTKYLMTIERNFRKDCSRTEIQSMRKRLVKLVNASLDPVLKTRNSHIHDERFGDEGIKRLGTLALLAQSGR